MNTKQAKRPAGEARHTKGPWGLTPYRYEASFDRPALECVRIFKEPIRTDQKTLTSIADVFEGTNAQRIVDCVNACEGINPEAVPEMLKALKSVVNYLDGLKGPFNHELLNLKDVIAKAEGSY